MGKLITSARNVRDVDPKSYIECIKLNPFCIHYIDKKYKTRRFLMKAFRANNKCLRWFHIEFKKDAKFMLYCISIDSRAIEYANIKLKKNKQFVIEAIRTNLDTIRFIDFFRNDPDIIEYVLKKNKHLLKYTLPDDPTIKKILSSDGLLLEYLPDSYKTTKYVLYAIRQNHFAYTFADPLISSHPAFICKALKTNGYVYNLLQPAALTNERCKVIYMKLALTNNPDVFHTLPNYLKYNKYIMTYVMTIDRYILNKFNFPVSMKNYHYAYIRNYVLERWGLLIVMYYLTCVKSIVPNDNNLLNRLSRYDKFFLFDFKQTLFKYIGLDFHRMKTLINLYINL